VTRSRQEHLALQRQQLVLLADAQRRRLAQDAAGLVQACGPLRHGAGLGRALGLWTQARRHPVMALLPVLALLLWRRKGLAGALGLAGSLVSLWRSWRDLQR
jgi:hypothetical protein